MAQANINKARSAIIMSIIEELKSNDDEICDYQDDQIVTEGVAKTLGHSAHFRFVIPCFVYFGLR